MPPIRPSRNPSPAPLCAPYDHIAPHTFGAMPEGDDFMSPLQASFRTAMVRPTLPSIPAPGPPVYAPPSARSAFVAWAPQHAPTADAETYDLLLNYSLQRANVEGALRIHTMMLVGGIARVPATTQRLVEALRSAKAWSFTCEVLRLAREAGEPLPFAVVHQTIDAVLARGDGIAARKMSEAHFGRPVSISLCHMILRRLCDNNIGAADSFLQDLLENTQLKVDSHAYCLILQGFVRHGNLLAANRVLDFLEAHRMHHSPIPYTMLMKGYAKAGRMREVAELFDRMVSAAVAPSAITYATAIRGCADHGRLGEAVHYWDAMGEAGWAPNCASVDALLKAAIKAGDQALARQLYRQGQTLGLNLNPHQLRSLAQMGVVRGSLVPNPVRTQTRSQRPTGAAPAR